MPLVRHAEDLWSTEYEHPWQAGTVPIPVRTTVMRLRDGRLVLHSPGPITPALRAELAALGPVGFLVIPYMHGKHAAEAAQAYPDAQLLAAPKPPAKRKDLAFHAALADQPPAAWAGQIETHLLQGFRLNEVLLLHRPSRTLVITDLCFNIHSSRYRWARIFFRLDGMWKRFGPSWIIRYLGPSDRAALRSSLVRVLQWDFERILPGHGDVIEHGGRAALRAAWLREAA
jgi:glyoxylase-like metal-dependent hydrolase (beta-lactamase superfamily II)